MKSKVVINAITFRVMIRKRSARRKYNYRIWSHLMKFIIYIKNSICFDKESKVNINFFRMTNFLGMGMMEIHASMFWNNGKQLNQLNTSFLKIMFLFFRKFQG